MPGPTPPFRSGSTINFYAGSTLNRFSWLRTSTDFINGAVTSPSARFIILNKLNPLVRKSDSGTGSGNGGAGELATLSWEEVRDTVRESIRLARGGDEDGTDVQGGGIERVFGPDVFGMRGPSAVEGGEATPELEAAKKQFTKATESMGPPNLVLVFLGVDESESKASPSVPGQVAVSSGAGGQDATASGDGVKEGQQLEGIPYFALSVSYEPQADPHQHGSSEQKQPLPAHKLKEELLATGKYEFVDTRSLAQAASWPAHHAAVLAQARSLVDWNERMAYCPGCSRKQYSLWSGHKRSCSSVLSSSNPSTQILRPFLPATSSEAKTASFETDGKIFPCPATQSLSNFSYPRTDSVVIMGVLNRTGDKILLGRQKTWPKKMYSCLAGFLEAGESLEEAVKREIYEEAAIAIDDVVYHSSQPWPFPANLMIGCFAICKSDKPESEIRLDLDNELEDARFFTREEVLEVIESSANRIMTKKDLERYEAGQNRNLIGQKKPTANVDDKGQWKKGEDSGAEDSEGEKEGPEKKSTATKWNTKDEGSVANVQADVKVPRSFAIPASTAIAHVLIASWARGEAHIPGLPQSSRM
ncbi:hypothetical protein CF319_g5993 [Tilletia indica]|nr:hypothetical protein CF319_g5993 [Tilletia indica]